MRGLEAAVHEVLDRRLSRASAHPLAVALSGGGDSLALTLIADAWARARRRELAILTVDHGLSPESAVWTRACAALAERLGRPFQALAWVGDKPATGLPAAARSARHRLLADAARVAGARVLLMGHTGDDIAEAHAMRATGSTTPAPREWAPSPVWPEGRDVFVLRPMLTQSRADLRDWLQARGETWIDDPANDDPRFARSRARAAGASALTSAAREDAPPSELFRLARHTDGAITIPRDALRTVAREPLLRFVSVACVCVGGGDRRPATDRLERLAEALRSGDHAFVATLAGARVEAGERDADIFREVGEFHRRGLPPLPLPEGREMVWDGRYAVTARRPGLVMQPAAAVAGLLRPDPGKPALPARRRGGFPAVVYPDGAAELTPDDGPGSDVKVEALVPGRFQAAAGLVQREPA